ncbi:hypothetical protein [Nostoc sp.]|uniref:hypothetical protein n=1 Tax=Nostoc sp. TaxID=1180 RepID=UPI002FFC8865
MRLTFKSVQEQAQASGHQVEEIAQQMDFLVQPAFVGYEISCNGQVLGLAKKLNEVVKVLPQYKEAIFRYEQLKQSAAQSEPVEEQIDDYLFHEQPANLPVIGNTHFIGSFLLRCAQIGGEYAVVWDVHDENNLMMGEIKMDWNCSWFHTMSLNTFATPQEAVVDLHQSLQEFKPVAMLLDKPFDELTSQDWERIGASERELVAA